MKHDTTEKKPPEPMLEAKNTKSKGERLFDWGVYGGIAGVGTFLLTVPVTYALKYGKWNAQYAAVTKSLAGMLSRVFSNKTSEEAAEKAVMTTALMMGGNLMVVPVGVIEKHKVPIVSGLNVMMGDKTPSESIEQTPKQTWPSLIQGRLLAWGAVFASLTAASKIFEKTFTTFENEFGEQLCKLFKKPAEHLVDGSMKPTRAFLYGKIGALDIFATAAAATLLYVGGHFFARKQAEKKAEKIERHSGHRETLAVIDEAPKAVGTHVEGNKHHQGMVAEPTRTAQLTT